MKGMRTAWLAVALVVPVTGTACSSAARSQSPGQVQPAGAEPSKPATGEQDSPGTIQSRPPGAAGARSNEEFERIFRAKQDSARMRFTKADVDFITHMIPHHSQAIEMSVLAPKNSTNPTIHTLAARIINAQKDEIRIMETWLRDRGQPVPQTSTSGGGDHAGHQMPGMSSHSSMPGMLTPEQLRELGQTKGLAFDRLFLTRMIAHHRGAVTMVQSLFATDGAANDEEVAKIASEVNVDQLTEIARMELMLRALPTSQP